MTKFETRQLAQATALASHDPRFAAATIAAVHNACASRATAMACRDLVVGLSLENHAAVLDNYMHVLG